MAKDDILRKKCIFCQNLVKYGILSKNIIICKDLAFLVKIEFFCEDLAKDGILSKNGTLYKMAFSVKIYFFVR